MLNKVELLCNLIDDKRISSEKLINEIKNNEFNYSEKAEIIESILYDDDREKILENFSESDLEICFSLLLIDGISFANSLAETKSKKILKILENAAIKTNNPYYICKIALEIKFINIEKLETALINIGIAEYIYNFACNVKGANIEKLENAIINSNDIKVIYEFARVVKGTNIEKLEEAIINSKDVIYIYKFAKSIERANIQKLENAIINSNDVDYIYKFAATINASNLEKLEKAVIKIGLPKYICDFAAHIEGANIEKLEEAIIATNDGKFIYYFARCVKGANIERLENAIINSKNAEYIYNFACNINGANIEKLEEAILATNDINFIIRFSKYIGVSPSEKLILKVMKLMTLSEQANKVHEVLIKKYNLSYKYDPLNLFNDSQRILKFVKEYFDIEVEDIKQARKLVEDNFIEIINDIGLCSLDLLVSDRDFSIKKIVLKKLEESYPENQEILQVYYEFLTNYLCYGFEDFMNFDIEYLQFKNEDSKIKSLGKN